MKRAFFNLTKGIVSLIVLLSLMLVSILGYASITQVPSITSLDAFTSVPTGQDNKAVNASIPTRFDSKQLDLDWPITIGLEYLQNTGVVLDGQYNKQFTDNWAASVLGQYGADLYRINATAGLLIGSNNLFKITVERLSEVLPFQFDSGAINQRVNQNAVGARYQIGFDLSLVNAINAGGYYAQANSINLPASIFTSNGLSYTNYRNIAGSTSGGGDVGIISTLGEKTQLNTHIYYDRVNYATQFSDGAPYNSSGLGASAGLTQIITPRTKLILNAEGRKIYDSLQVALAFLPKLFNQYNMQFSISAARFIPHNSIPSSNSIGAQLAFNLENDLYAAKSHYSLDNPANPSLQNWTNTPAVYMAQVLAVAEQDTVLSVPAISAITPSSGPVGTLVTISGNGFLGATDVSLSGVSIAFTLVNNSAITFTAPIGALGVRNVSVTTPGGTDTVIDGFTYTLTLNEKSNLKDPLQVPVVTSISPTSGITGTLVTITGTSLDGLMNVRFGPTIATVQQGSTSTQIMATAPAGNNTVNIIVTTDGGTSTPSSADQFTYQTAPTVTNFSPAVSSTSGGSTVTVTGTGFTGTSAVTFGGTSATSYNVVSDTELTAVTPAKAAGSVELRVTNLAGSEARAPFTYVAPPTVTSVIPNSGPTAGGTIINLVGTNFVGVDQVSFGGTPGIVNHVAGETNMTVTSPPGAAGVVNVIVSELVGGARISSDAATANQYTYAAAPTITTIAPTSGPLAGNTTVTITGTNFVDSGTTVSFDGDAGTNITFVSTTEITVDTPAHVAGAVNVVVATAGGSDTATNGYTYLDAPTILTVTPDEGTTAGGTAVTITGTNFVDGGTTVTFGGLAATILNFGGATEITVEAPGSVGMAAGPVNVVVTTADGSATSVGGFTYVAPTPVISSINPDVGPSGVTTPMTITGTGFSNATSVTFNGFVGSGLNVLSDTTIEVTTPGQGDGPVDVVVNTPGGASAAALYTNASAPQISTISPNTGLPAGGTSVTITGTNFINGNTTPLTVTFDGVNASVTVNSSTVLTVITPAHVAGAVDVVVTTGGGSVTETNGFTYINVPIITTIDPPVGPVAGGTLVTITGDYFVDGGTTVTFGGQAATIVSFGGVSDFIVEAPPSPSDAPGAVNVVVSTAGGSATAVNGFRYVGAPTITTIAPDEGTTAGGTAVTITGTNFVDGGTTVTFGGQAATIVQFVSATQIIVEAPVSVGYTAGAVDVVVTTVDGSDTSAGGFTYVAPTPVISSIDPDVAPTGVGTLLTLTGTGFSNATSVTFDGFDGLNLNVVSDTEIRVNPADLGDGTVDVVVNTPGGTSLPISFTYAPAPQISTISPNTGLPAGGTSVTITGTNFINGNTTPLTVTFDGVNASVTVNSSTVLTVITPAHVAGAVDVVVTTGGGSVTETNGFTYINAPIITTIDPPAGPVAGGTLVTITGDYFVDGGTTVTFGGVDASVTVNSATELTVVTPAHAAGAVDVVVTTGGGSVTETNGFSYIPPPTIATITPANGPETGGTTVTITGTGFIDGGTTVTFGGDQGHVVFDSVTRIFVDTPGHAAGAVDVVVTTVNGSDTETNGFTYVGTPAITSIDPDAGGVAGGDTITLLGSGFTGTTSVTFDGDPGTGINVVNDTRLTVVTPAHAVGAVDVVVTSAGGTSAPGVFTYALIPTVTSVAPNSGGVAGGTTVTITGTLFTGATAVSFGGVNATSYTVNSATQITAVAPPAASDGSVHIRVTTIAGTSSTSNDDLFTYTLPGSVLVTGGSLTAANMTPITAFGGGISSTSTTESSESSGGEGSQAPAVSIAPAKGSMKGGTKVSIDVTDAKGVTGIQFGGNKAASFSVDGNTITAVTPPANHAGAVKVTISKSDSSMSVSKGFTYTR